MFLKFFPLQLLLSILVAFGCCDETTQYFKLDQKLFDTLPKLPKSFSEEDWTRVQLAIQNSINCQEQNLNWNQTVYFDFNEAGYPNCIAQDSRKRVRDNHSRDEKPCSKIPKIIHQQWKNKTVPEEWLNYHKGWESKNPDWVLLLWTEEDQIEWIKANYDWFIGIFRNFPYDVERADSFRYFLMWSYGGVYVDIDYECKKPLSDYISEIRKPVALVSPEDNGFSNTMIISVPKHELWGTAIEQIYQNPTYFYALTQYEHILQTAGPKFLNRMILNSYYNQDVCSLQKSMFHPCSTCDSDEECNLNCIDCYSSHHFPESWNDWSSSFINLGKCSAPTSMLEVVELGVSSLMLFLGLCLTRRWYRRRKILKRRVEHPC